MRPPICAICRKDFRKDISSGGSVSFKLSEANKLYNEKFKQRGFVGHRAGLEWFCGAHLVFAKQYSHLTWKEAYLKIKEDAGI